MTLRLLATTCALALTAAAAAQAEYTLHILHVNDFHSRIEPINGFDSTCNAEQAAANECFGGAARLMTMVTELRADLAGQNVILLDAGDQYQGSLMYTTYKGDAEIEMMNLIGFDAMAVGNHEFDDGPAGLAKLIDGATFPILSGNIDVSQEPLLAGRLNNSLVLDIGGDRIGLISALATDTPETSSPGANVIFTDAVESLQADVDALTAEGVTKIIALNHLGLAEDMRIAAAVTGLDAVIGGHSHTLFSNTAEGAMAYPTMVGAVPVVQAYAYGKYLGHLTLTFDDAGNVISATGDTILLDASVAEDPAILARVAERMGPIAELRDRVVAEAATEIIGAREECRARECAMGNLVADAMLARVVAEAATEIIGAREECRARECAMGNLVADAMLARVADQGITIAIQNGGGLRASIDAGAVTMGEVLTVLPFQNTLSTFEVSGEAIVAALENGVSQVEEGSGRFPQVAGLTFTFDPAAPAGARVSDVMVRQGDAWAPIDPAATYGVVSNNFIRKGGDGYVMFTEAANAYDFGPDLADVTAEYLAANSPYQPYTDGRITLKD